MDRSPRTEPIELIVIHVNVGPERDGGARSLGNVLAGQAGGYHLVVDNKEIIRYAEDNQKVAGAKGGHGNARGLHVCLIGYASQSRDEWLDAYSQGEFRFAQWAVAAWCKTYGIDARHLSLPEIRNHGRGICGHVDITGAFAVSGGHTDPGGNFPWDLFIGGVQWLLTPPTEVPKVTPAYQPPILMRAIVDEERAPNGGVWLLAEDGSVYAWGSAPFFGGPNGQSYWAGRKAARLHSNEKGGYTVEATSGEKYAYP